MVSRSPCTSIHLAHEIASLNFCPFLNWTLRLHLPEDIDFEFVYALHTFVATVEGQANATKGDTMVLLDDSNSYWWLVRVVKDSSIGKHACGTAENVSSLRRK